MPNDIQNRAKRFASGLRRTTGDIARILIGSFLLASATSRMAGAEEPSLLAAVLPGGAAETAAIAGLMLAALLVMFSNRLSWFLRKSPDADPRTRASAA